MFDLLKMLFYTFVAVVVGVFIGTVPVGGRTIGERIASLYQSSSTPAGAKPAAVERPARAEPQKSAARPAARARSAPPPAQVQAQAQAQAITAGAANSPDGHSAEERDALDKLLSSRKRR